MKKEKKEKLVPTQEELNKMVVDYLRTTEKHVSQVKYTWDKEYKDNLLKVFPKFLNGKLYYIKIEFSSVKVDVKIVDTSWVSSKNGFGMLKNRVFQQNMNHKSIKPSIDVKIKMDIVKEFISFSEDFEVLKSEIRKILN